MFVRNYELIKTAKGEKPLLQVLRDRVCQSVFESDLFALRDAAMSEALQDAEVPDCVLRGSLAGFRERGGCYVYRLQLVLIDPKTGAVFWQGFDTFLKVVRYGVHVEMRFKNWEVMPVLAWMKPYIAR